MTLSNFHYDLLLYLKENPCTLGLDLQNTFFNNAPLVEESLEYLYNLGAIISTISPNEEIYLQQKDLEGPSLKRWGFSINWRFRVTPLGCAFMEDHHKELEQMDLQRKDLANAIADSKAAKKNAFIANIIAITSLVFSIYATLCSYGIIPLL